MRNFLNEEIDKIKSLMDIGDTPPTIEDKGNYSIEQYKKYIVTKPKSETNGATIIYGGLLDTPEKLLSDIPEELLNSKIVVLSRFDKGFNDLVSDVKKLTTKNGSSLFGLDNLNITSVNGFSTGALRIQNVLGNYNFVGLIDPWLTNTLLNKLEKNSDNVESWFSKKFWKEQLGKYTNTEKLQDRLKSILGDNSKELPEYEHENVKKDFLRTNWRKM